LAIKGFDPGEINGDYGPITQAAVADFQQAEGLVVDGAVGPETAEALGISLVEGPIQPGNGGYGLDLNSLLPLILALLSPTGKADGRPARQARPGHRLSSTAFACAAAGDAAREANCDGGTLG
jgi:peptidoglycan hydrolase-like protein with peptidoglycan-binding domain